MKAYVLHEIGKIEYEDAVVPVPGEDEVLLAVKAAGVCGSDIPRIYRTGTYSYPLIPGHEFSGVVAEIGSRADADWLHKRVGVFPLIPCKKCGPCQQGKYEMCRNYSYLGSRCNGGFAEYVCVPVWNLLPLPEEVSFEQAAMLEPMAVAVHAMRRVGLGDREKVQKNSEEDVSFELNRKKRDMKIAIYGMGTIGLLLLMFLLEQGYSNVFAIGNKDFQRNMAVKLGLPEEQFCDIRKIPAEEWLLKQTKDVGADVCFECVGRKETVVQAIKSAVPGGSICMVGNPASDMEIPKDVYWKILRNQLTVCGTWNSSFGVEKDDWSYVISRLKEGKIAPQQLISHRFQKEKLVEGFKLMRDKKEEYGKVMGLWE